MKSKLMILFSGIITLACAAFLAACANVPDENVPYCEHEYSIQLTVDPACETQGYSLYVCEKCGEEYYEYFNALGHDWVEKEVVLPTCTESGIKFYVCSECGLTKSEDVPATGHIHTEWHELQVLHGLYCNDCNTWIKQEVHNFVDGACSECGADYDEFLDTFNGSYGYEYLGTLQNGEGLQALYREIDESARLFHNNGADAEDGRVATLNYAQYGISQSEAISVWKTYHDDNPLFYWLSNRIGYNSTVIALLCLDDYTSGSARTQQNKLLYTLIDEMLGEAYGETSAYMYAFAFHDAIIKRVEYTASDADGNAADWAHNICGVLEGLGAVCEGYSRTFQLLLNACGVENVFVTGNNHAWNLVRLDDGNWYWYDLTWDDSPNSAYGVIYLYFCVTDEEFLVAHTPDSYLAEGKNFLYDLPARAEYGYSPDEVGYNSSFTVEGVEYTVVGYGLVKPSEDVLKTFIEYNGRGYTVVS